MSNPNVRFWVIFIGLIVSAIVLFTLTSLENATAPVFKETHNPYTDDEPIEIPLSESKG